MGDIKNRPDIQRAERGAQPEVTARDAASKQRLEKAGQENAARAAQGAGFGLGARKGKLNLGSTSGGTTPLPEDDIAHIEQDVQQLAHAQANMTLANGKLEQAGEGVQKGGSLAESVIKENYLITEQSMGELQALADREPDPGPDMGATHSTLQKYFGISIADLPRGMQMLATGIAVAGLGQDLKKTDEASITESMQFVVTRGGRAVTEAQLSASGVARQMSQFATYVPRR